MGHHAVFTFCVSDACNFTANPSSVCDYGYRAFGELAGFACWLLQKIKSAQSLPLVEKCEDLMLPNDSQIPPIEEKEFLPRSRVAGAREKVSNVYLRNEFRKDARNFLEELTSAVLSTVAARSDVGQGLSSFYPKIVVRGWLCPFSFVWPASRWLNGVGLCPWLNGWGQWGWVSVFREGLEAVGAHLHEDLPRCRNILSAWSSQVVFWARRNLCEVGNIFFDFLLISSFSYFPCFVFQLTALVGEVQV